ncbi:unnamed protein product [Rotaria socialis]
MDSILPCYPSSNDLLLTNVPTRELNEKQLEQRQRYGYYKTTMITTSQHDHHQWMTTLSQSWNIHRDVLEFNFRKLLTLVDRLAHRRMYHFSTNAQHEYLSLEEYKVALEFYLQMDHELFYMKTCSYQDSQSIENEPKNIFLTNERPPYGHYTMDACQQQSCCLCYPFHRLKQKPPSLLQRHRESQSTIQHIFVNGFRSILNCPAACTTQNTIYVLTCPCQQFDYIGETSLSLPHRLTYHRKHGNRIIKEFLLGKKLTNYINHGEIKSFETLVKDGMQLYQHSCHCSVAMQYFLDENPEYWPFIPQRMTDSDEQQQERELPVVDTNQYQFANDVPLPTNMNYHLTVEQKLDIEKFFQEKKYLHTPNFHLDLYEAKIIAVLPKHTSSTLRRVIEALFITQAQTKLNTFGHLDIEYSTMPISDNEELCYENLIFHSIIIMENLPRFNNIDWFDDIFDIVTIDDDMDDDRQEIERMIMEDYYEDLDFYSDQEDTEEEEEEQQPSIILDKMHGDQQQQQDQEQMLSQKLSQLSTEGHKRPLSTPSTSQEENPKKKICLPPTDIDVQHPEQTNQITSYLETMDDMFHRTMFHDNGRPLPNNLKNFIHCQHGIGVAQLHLKRWTRYREAGVQQQIWSNEVKKLFTMKEINEKQYAIYVEKYINKINQKLEELQQQKNTLKEDGRQWMTDIIEDKLNEFIETYRLLPSRMKSDYYLAQFEYDYQDQLLEREFLSLQPTEQQIEMATNLYKAYNEYIQTKYEFIELKHRVQCNQPTQTSVTQASSMLLMTLTSNPEFFHQDIDYENKQLQKYFNECMTKAIVDAEKKLYECQRSYQEQEKLASSILTSDSLMTIIQHRYRLAEEKYHGIQEFHLNYYLRQHFGQQSDDFNLAKISFLPTIIVHASMHDLNKEHLQLLSRGPTYVSPYQQLIEENLEKNYKPLQHDLNKLLVKSDVNLVQTIILQKQVKDLYMKMFSKTTTTTMISKAMLERAYYEQQLIDKIRNDLKSFNLILRRTANRRNVFYLGDRILFEKLCNEFMLETDRFELEMEINNDNVQETQDYLQGKIKSMNREFKTIFMDTKKYKDQLNRITVLIGKVELPYLYFLPDLWKQTTLDVKPMVMVTKQSATYRLGQFIDSILRTVINIHRQGRMFSNGSDFLRKFHEYIDRTHRLSSKTKFVTITIGNFYHMVSHDHMLNTLTDFFLQCYHLPCIENIQVTKVIQLISLFLHNNRFYYDGKIYRYRKGGPASSGLIETLSNIYLSRMEQCLIEQNSMHNEFYGRYQNQIFFTWNHSMDELDKILQSMTSKYKDYLDFHIQVQDKLTYLDIYLENRHGSLYSRIQHQPTYTLPYVSNGNAIRTHSHWLRSSLIRAVRYCTTIEDFHQERIYLEMTYLANGYSWEFVEKHLKHFFKYFDGKAIQQLHLDQHGYEKFRRRLFNFMYEQRQYMEKKQDALKKYRRFPLSYIYDNISRKGEFNKKLRQILVDNIQLHNLKFESTKLKFDITTKSQYSLNALLSQQRPIHAILNKQ